MRAFDPVTTSSMRMLLYRIAVGAVCVAAVFPAVSHAFLPSPSTTALVGSSSSSSWAEKTSSRLARASGLVDRRGSTCAAAGGKAGTTMATGEHDLFIVGAGYLGKKIGALWHERHPEAKMIGETRSFTRHKDFMPPGMTHMRRKFRDENEVKMPNVVFCANPGGNSDYALEVLRAIEDVWDGTGVFLFTSSGSVYAEKDGGMVTENSPIDEAKVDGPLRIAEKVTLRGGGIVVRLAGLYSVERGPHSVWLDEKRMNHHSQGMVNMISYDDAAGAVVAALDAGLGGSADEVKGQVFLASAGAPITRKRICEVALAHPLYGRKKMPIFQQDASPIDCTDAGPKKVYDSSETRRILGWEPRYPSMEEFFKSDQAEWDEEGGGRGE